MSKIESSHLFVVILAGGSGTRLWPISRELYPKQLLALLGKKTLIQQTVERAKKLVPVDHIRIVTGSAFVTDILLQLRPLGISRSNIIIEPGQRNTAPALALAVASISRVDADAMLLVLPADHIIDPDSAFIRAVKSTLSLVEEGKHVVFGIPPTSPSSEYGYIKPKLGKSKKGEIVPVEKFVEKPNSKIAELYIHDGYLWNAGIFLFSASALIRSIRTHLPEVSQLLFPAKGAPVKVFEPEYLRLPNVSIDNGILEHAKNIVVCVAPFGWRDIGSWKVLYELAPKDEDGNALNDDAIALACEGSLVFGSPGRVAAAIGMKDTIIVDTEDAILVVNREETHRIKEVYLRLKAENKRQHREHRTSARPWGSYTILDEGETFKVKRLVVLPGERLSLQSHAKRSEHWVVINGTARATVNRDIRYLDQGHSIEIPCGAKHRLENPGDDVLEIIEVQRGDYLGEDDIVRYDDKYERE